MTGALVALKSSISAVLLITSLTLVSGAVLQHGGNYVTGLSATVKLIIGDADRMLCLQVTGPVPTSIGWFNPESQLVSRDFKDEVNQAATGGGRVAYLNFRNYSQSQGGKYECRVVGPGNNLEMLSVCIGECYPLGVAVHKE